MSSRQQIEAFLRSLPEPKRQDMTELHQRISKLQPKTKQWFDNGLNSEGKVVTNPTIGYGSLTMQYANGSSKETFQVGLSANTSGISVYIMGISDKLLLQTRFGRKIGKATLTGYCIKFKKLSEVNADVLDEAVKLGFEIVERR